MSYSRTYSEYLGARRCCNISSAGPQGPQGVPGMAGPIGFQGATGPSGGPQGATGAQGGTPWFSTNYIGVTGPGYTGTGYTGDAMVFGNLLVTGGIDPTYLALTPQASDPLPAGLDGMWIETGGSLRVQKMRMDDFSGATAGYIDINPITNPQLTLSDGLTPTEQNVVTLNNNQIQLNDFSGTGTTTSFTTSNLSQTTTGPTTITTTWSNMINKINSISPFGNTAVVDAVYGNDSTASVGGLPYLTVEAAVTAVSSGQTVWILPGTYTLASGITIKDGTSIRGMSLQTTTIQMLNVTTDTTLITIGEECRIEDITLLLTSSEHHTLTGILFEGTTSVTSKLRTAVLTVDNSTAPFGGTSNVYGVVANGTGVLTSESFSFNCLKASTINVYSNGRGIKRGILVSGTNIVTTRDLNVYVASPTNTASTGSYVGIETNDPTETGSIEIRTTTVGTKLPILTQLYTASDILQTTPNIILNPSYLASKGIQVGPGTDLVTKSAGDKGFSTYNYPVIVYYGLRGNVTSGPSGGWLWPGSQTVSAGVWPDTGTPPPFFRIQQPSLISGISGSINVAPATGNVTLAIQFQPIADQDPDLGPATFTGEISGNILTVTIPPAAGTKIQIGQLLTGSGITNRTYIISGSGTSWIVNNSQIIASTAMTSTCYKAGATFSGTISGTTLTVTTAVVGTIQIGQYLSATSGITSGSTGVLNGTYITAQLTPTTWTLNQTFATPVTPAIAMRTYSIIPTIFQIIFIPSPTTLSYTFYDASLRLNTGDRLLLYLSYSGATNAHDVTAQIDLF